MPPKGGHPYPFGIIPLPTPLATPKRYQKKLRTSNQRCWGQRDLKLHPPCPKIKHQSPQTRLWSWPGPAGPLLVAKCGPKKVKETGAPHPTPQMTPRLNQHNVILNAPIFNDDHGLRVQVTAKTLLLGMPNKHFYKRTA